MMSRPIRNRTWSSFVGACRGYGQKAARRRPPLANRPLFHAPPVWNAACHYRADSTRRDGPALGRRRRRIVRMVNALVIVIALVLVVPVCGQAQAPGASDVIILFRDGVTAAER